jgi:hypothetical protein
MKSETRKRVSLVEAGLKRKRSHLSPREMSKASACESLISVQIRKHNRRFRDRRVHVPRFPSPTRLHSGPFSNTL